MRAAVCHAFGRPLVVEEVEIDSPGRGEVAVRIAACGICRSDVASIEGAWGGPLPAVYGHEAAGVVEETGRGVAGVEVGDHVVVTLIRSCGRCPFCARGEPAFCEAPGPRDRRSPLRFPEGAEIVQGFGVGAFAERVVVHASQAVPIPRALPLEPASLLGCAVLSGVGAVVNTARVEAGSSVVVIGAGGVGLNCLQGAVLAGADPIVAVDVAEAKLEAARLFGATHAVHAAGGGVDEAVRGLTGGRGADYVFVAAGAPGLVEQGLALLRRGGALVVIGMPASGARSAIDPTALAHDGLRILGSKLGSARPHVDIPTLAELYRQGRLKLDGLVSARYPLEDVNEALESAARGDALRSVLVPGQGP